MSFQLLFIHLSYFAVSYKEKKKKNEQFKNGILVSVKFTQNDRANKCYVNMASLYSLYILS